MTEPNHPFQLSQYERERKPIELIEDEDAEIDRSFSELFTCSICRDLFTEVHITRECFHRFCRECIVTALSKVGHECPMCRAHIATKRHLRPDPEFDDMQRVFYPDQEQYQRQQAENIGNLLSKQFVNLDLDTSAPNKRGKKPAVVEEIEVELIPRKDEDSGDAPQLRRRYIKVPKTFTIEQLKCFFSLYPKWKSDQPDIAGTSQASQYYIYSFDKETKFTMQPDHMPLSNIYTDQTRPLRLYYRHVFDVEDFSFE